MTTEEKAKAYDEAIEIAKDYVEKQNPPISALCEIFPELAGSEDEKIRKALVRFHKSTIDIDGIKGADILAWLEKQCEQKNKINSYKITFEDVLVLECAMKTIKITEGGNELYEKLAPLYNKIHNVYLLEKQGEQKPSNVDYYHVDDEVGNPNDWVITTSHDKVEPKFKIGDVLCDKSCTTLNKNSQPNIEILDIRDGMYICNNCTFPIEQQDEYELVAKKIEDEIEIPFGAKDSELQEETYYIPKGFHAEIDDDKVVIKKGEKSAAWSDEDELVVLSIEQVIQCASFLNLVPEKLDKIDKWLKSLKQRYTWKPSEKQMEALHNLNLIGKIDYVGQAQALIELYNDLKEL